MSKLASISTPQIADICREAGITYLALFGSHARGEQRHDSDVDLLVEFAETPSLISFIRTKHKLEQALNSKVDLVTKKGLSRYIEPDMQSDLTTIWPK